MSEKNDILAAADYLVGDGVSMDVADAERIAQTLRILAAGIPSPVRWVEMGDERGAQAEAMARRLLWLAYAWNDHNFDAAHIEARREAAKYGIRSFEDANAWLSAASAPKENDRG
jgi:hypothetical protein